jgi:integrase
LQLCVTEKGVKSFYLRKKINGVSKRIFIGHFPDLSVENARKIALDLKNDIAKGNDPHNKKQKFKQELTIKGLFAEYLERYSKIQKKNWKNDLWEFEKYLSCWSDKKISNIANNDVRLLHEKIAKENGLYQANRILSRISSVFNKAIEWGYEDKNPAIGIKKFKEQARDRFVQNDELPKLFESINQEENQDMRDYFYLSLLTGARKSNVLSMKWQDVNFNQKSWRIPETKNGEIINIPLLDEAIEILQKRLINKKNEWVFASSGKTGHLVEPKSAWKRILTRAGIENLRIHDLRRTLGSYQAITGASLQIIGKSLGHKSTQATQVYSRLHLDLVRASMEKAVSEMFGKNDK